MHSLYNKAEFGHKNRPGSFYRLHRLLSVLRKEQLVNSRTLAKHRMVDVEHPWKPFRIDNNCGSTKKLFGHNQT
jgi:hypothetical protein